MRKTNKQTNKTFFFQEKMHFSQEDAGPSADVSVSCMSAYLIKEVFVFLYKFALTLDCALSDNLKA